MTTKIKNIGLQVLNRLKKKPTKYWSTYTHIKQISLDKFISIHCDGKLSLLVLSGRPTKEELQEVWEKLFKQYVETIGGNSFESKLSDIKDFEALRDKVVRATYCIELLKYKEGQEKLYKVINTFGYSIGMATKENIKELLPVFESHLKRDIVLLNKMVARLDKGSEEETEITEETYYTAILDIQEALNISINPREDSAFKYALAIKKLHKHIDRIIKQNEKTKKA